MTYSFSELLKTRAQENPCAPCFYDATKSYEIVTYADAWERVKALAQSLTRQGVEKGSWCATDMENSAEYIYLLGAANLVGFTLVTLNARLSSSEKQDRLNEIVRTRKTHPRLLSELDIRKLWQDADLSDSEQRENVAHETETLLDSGIQDSSHDKYPAVVMFTSGTQGRPKGAILTWDNMIGAAYASNNLLHTKKQIVWQATLPFFHVGGLEIIFRSVCNGSPFVLYRKFSADQVVSDIHKFGVTHVSVVDKMLRDMLEAPYDTTLGDPLLNYECILLGGAIPNEVTLDKARRRNLAVRTSYGMTETCSHVASADIRNGFDGSMTLLPGYKAIVIASDGTKDTQIREAEELSFAAAEENSLDHAIKGGTWGLLALQGPGVITHYLQGACSSTADGYFLTGDTGLVVGNTIRVAERTGDMFVSGGENIYPEEVRKKLLSCEGVADAYVFGAPDETWGRRPIAFVEVEKECCASSTYNDIDFARAVHVSLKETTSRLLLPREVMALPEFPRKGIGKIDRATLMRAFEERVAPLRAEVWQLSQPMVNTQTAKTSLKHRESIIVEITDIQGRKGIAECVAFSTDWYGCETLSDDWNIITREILPEVIGSVYLHPLQVSRSFEQRGSVKDFPLAMAAVEPAFWDLYGQTCGKSIRELLGGRAVMPANSQGVLPQQGYVPGGVVFGLMKEHALLKQIRSAVDEGYSRIKLKVKPGHDLAIVSAIREEFPDVTLMLDANQSYTEQHLDTLKALSQYHIACIEEPLDPSYVPVVGPRGLFDRLVRLQQELSYPICLDESWDTSTDIRQILTDYPDLRCVVMKIAKFGGVEPALEFYQWARDRGVTLWIGGMYDTGVSKRLMAAFASLPGMFIPGDISSSDRYFSEEICIPPFKLQEGWLEVNPSPYRSGLGCELDHDVINRLAVKHTIIE